MTTPFVKKTLILLTALSTNFATFAQKSSAEVLGKDPIKYVLSEANLGASGINLPGKGLDFSAFAEVVERGFLETVTAGVCKDFKNFSGLAGFSNVPKKSTYVFSSLEYSDRFLNTGKNTMPTNKKRYSKGFYAFVRATYTRVINKNEIPSSQIGALNKREGVDLDLGVRFIPRNTNRVSLELNRRYNEFIPGRWEWGAQVISTTPIYPPRPGDLTPNKGLYLGFGATGNRNTPINYLIKIGWKI